MQCVAQNRPVLSWLLFYMKVHLELADLGVKGEGVKEHGADESYMGRLAAEKMFSTSDLENNQHRIIRE